MYDDALAVLYWRPGDEMFHATPRCPDFPHRGAPVRRLVVDGFDVRSAPDDLYECWLCCPAPLFTIRSDFRVMVFHLDDECPRLPEQRLWETQKVVEFSWPSWDYARMVEDPGARYLPCRECVPNETLLHPLGSEERPLPPEIRRADARRRGPKPRRKSA